MKKASIFIMILSILSKLLGFVRETVLAAFIGAGDVSDAFVYSLSLPTTFFSVVIAAFVTGLIPMYTRVENDEGSDRAMRFLNNTLNIMLLFG
ncbi:MAG: murein biosynthesis integral membrane protein MurJ, partial [Erysipelothrix sp.]|nr:murein biosynthesis integral membrane protein MurJ [Erysipelothrix sp.]